MAATEGNRQVLEAKAFELPVAVLIRELQQRPDIDLFG